MKNTQIIAEGDSTISTSSLPNLERQNLTLEALAGVIEVQNKKIAKLEQALEEQRKDNLVSLLVFSNDFDKALCAFIIATGAVALGMEVNMFFTFWGTSILRKKNIKIEGKTIKEKVFDIMLPKGSQKLSLSQMHMMGAGTSMMKKLMKEKNIVSLEDMMEMVTVMGVKIQVCEMSMGLMGIRENELMASENREVAGVAKYLETAQRSKVALFI